jgi:ribosomal protein S12
MEACMRACVRVRLCVGVVVCVYVYLHNASHIMGS